MTRRLYYEDSYLKDFDAFVLELAEREGQHAVVLDQTAFYPNSGGQPNDTGTLGEARVLNVDEDSSGRILHYLDSVVTCSPVAGHVDWPRRFDHMQQHSGQHILSQAFVKVCGAQTISFHLGPETSTIDLDIPSPSLALMHEAEDLATKIVFDDLEVHVLNVARDELSALGVRKASDRTGPIRVIDVDGFDRSPCGGTHVRRAGEIGMIALLGYERYKGGTRVEFVCGWRALNSLRTDHDTLQRLARMYTAHPHDLPQLTEKMLQEKTALGKEVARLENQVLELEAEELMNHADKLGETRMVKRLFADRGIETIKVLAQKLARRPGVIALLAAADPSPQVILARSADAPGDCNAAVREVAARCGGRGGGRPELAQAGGMRAEAVGKWLDEAEACFRKVASL
jgi:alanyl-tRNA synthetase